MSETCRVCRKPAKFIVKSFLADLYVCGVHVKKYRKNEFCLIEKYKEDQLRDWDWKDALSDK